MRLFLHLRAGFSGDGGAGKGAHGDSDFLVGFLYGYVERLALAVHLDVAMLVKELGVNVVTVFIGNKLGNGFAVLVTLVVVSLEADAAGVYLTLRTLKESHYRHARYRLAASRLTYNADGGVLGNIEGYAVYSLYDTLICEEIGIEIFNLEDVGIILHFCGKFRLLRFAVLILFESEHYLGVFLRYCADLLAGEVILRL